MKVCRTCLEEKPLSAFWRTKHNLSGIMTKCGKCEQQYNSKYHAKAMRKYRKTFRGLLDQKYTSMSKRVRGKDRNCLNTVKGLPIIPREQFIAWATKNAEYASLYKEWQISGYLRNLTPTIDRIDSTKGYIFPNMQFLTFIDNQRKQHNGLAA